MMKDLLALILLLCTSVACRGDGTAPAAEPAAPLALKEALAKLKLPGVRINVEEKCVDVDARVCLDQGLLELIACTKDTKEHESIVVVDAKPVHIHTALLLLGATPGNPAMRRQPVPGVEQFIDIPPRGGAVDVFLVFNDEEGKPTERPASDFVVRAGEEDGAQAAADNGKFPTHTFVFAGSHLVGEGPGPRRYLCDETGNVISIVTFGDELLCLPEVHANDNEALIWKVDASSLPAVGTKVILRLRPHLKPAAR